jgi:hypothetical protein
MKSLFPRLCAVAAGTVLLVSAYYRTSSASVMTEAANRFLASLTAEQRAKATFQFEDAERVNWFFVPIERSGEGHYYRVQAPAFLIEYDNTQNDNNHIHTVWRDFTGDFGGDLLKDHYQASHQ